jgi:hypothetical protein
MNKNNTPLIIIGIIIIAILAYIALKPKSYTPTVSNTGDWPSADAIKQAQNDITDPGVFTPRQNNLTLYVNKDDGFQVQYPSDWTVNKTLEGRDGDRDTFAVLDSKNNAQLSIQVRSAEGCDTVTACMKVKDDTLPTAPFTIGGVTVQAWSQYHSTGYVFIYNKKIYDIDFQPSGDTSNADYPAFQSILASFKFI